jgi:UPF0755 protein
VNRRPPAISRQALAATLLLLLLLTAGGGVYTNHLLHRRQTVSEGARRVWLESPTDLEDFYRLASHRGLVGSRFSFRLAARLKGLTGPIAPAGYRFPASLSTVDVITRLQRGGSDFFKVTIPEGLMARQFSERLRRHGYPEAEALHALVTSPMPDDLRPDWLPGNRVEGFLFPDTYFIDYDSPPRQVVRQFLGLFETAVLRPLQGEISNSGRSLRDLVTLASLLEREVMKSEELPIVAGVLLNRLRRNQRLQCDATIQYALGYWKRRILFRDLRVDSPYNTYLHAGLPPGPICSPGLAAVLGALRPARHTYYFYVADGTGGHQFNRTYEEHVAAIRRIRGR